MSDTPSQDVLQVADGEEFGRLLEQHRPRLSRMVELRMHSGLRGRIDASDVIQDAYLEATSRREEYFREPRMPFFLWLRFLVTQRLMALQRFHLGAEKRTAERDVSLFHAPVIEASSAVLAAHLVGSLTSPSNAAIREERSHQLHEALNQLNPIDREIIALRNFEELSRAETAQVLGIQESATSKRYIRALNRLRAILNGSSDSSDFD